MDKIIKKTSHKITFEFDFTIETSENWHPDLSKISGLISRNVLESMNQIRAINHFTENSITIKSEEV